MDSLDPEDAARFLAWSEEELAEWRMDRIAQMFDAKVAPLLTRVKELEERLALVEERPGRPAPPPVYCTRPGCKRKNHALGLCAKHYQRAWVNHKRAGQVESAEIVSLPPPPERGTDQAA